MSIEEVVYSARDNVIALALSSDGIAIAHNTLTRVQVQVGATLLDSAVAPTLFVLSAADRLTLKLGQAGLLAGRYQATLIVFDASNPNGIVWGSLVIIVK